MKKRFDYILTPSIRRKLKKPLGRLLLPSQLRTDGHLLDLREAKLVITVGDRVTETLHELGRTPDVQVVDGRERRIQRAVPEIPFARLIRVKNPAGRITKQAIDGISSSIRSRKRPVRVLVDGEEDLLAIPAVAEAPEGSILYYGQPKKGVVLLAIDEKARVSARRTLRQLSKK